MKIRTGFFLAVVSLLFCSCYAPRYMYSPAAQNVPLLVKKGDSKLSANYSTDLFGNVFRGGSSGSNRKNSSGFDLQGAVALTNHFALQANYFNRTEKNWAYGNNEDSFAINYKRNLTEIGIGYFTSMHRKNKAMFQVFGGVGKGSFSFTDKWRNLDSIYLNNHSTDVLKIYVQPAFQFRIRQNFAISVSSRLSIIHFSNIKTNYSEAELGDYKLYNLSGGSRTFWEPAFTNTFGFKKLKGVKFEYQLSTAVQVSGRRIDYRSFNFSLGIALDIPKIFQPVREA